MTRYLYRHALGGLFHVDEGFARARLPAALSPFGFRLGNAIFSLMVFDFVDSEAGPFTELALMLIVPPGARPGQPLPEVGLFPWLLATSTPASRELAASRLRLPVHPRDIECHFERDAGSERVEVVEGGRTVLRLRIGRRPLAPTERLFQCFARGPAGLYDAPVRMQGWLGEHEDETGLLTLGEHPIVADLAAALADDVPFREQVVAGGQEEFGAMEVWS
jgi:hypothetical protein